MPAAVTAALTAGAELSAFYIIGRLIPIGRRGTRGSAAETLCIGFLAESALFEVIALLFTWTGASLTAFARVWSVAIAVLIGAALVAGQGAVIRDVQRAAKRPGIALTELVILLTAVAAAAYAAAFPALGSGAETVLKVSADVSNDAISLFGAAGTRLRFLPSYELLNRFSVKGSYLVLLTGLSPAEVCDQVGVIVTVFLSVMAFYRLFVRVFGGNRRNAAVAEIMLVGINLFVRTRGAGSFMMFESGWSGNSVMVNVLLPVLLIIADEIAAISPGNGAKEGRTLPGAKEGRGLFGAAGAAKERGDSPGGAYAALLLFGISAVSWSRLSILVCPAAMAVSMLVASLRAGRKEPLVHLLPALIFPAAALVLILAVPHVMVTG